MVFFLPSADIRINYSYSESESLNSIRINELFVNFIRARCQFTTRLLSNAPQ
jgi:hypothetical protein